MVGGGWSGSALRTFQMDLPGLLSKAGPHMDEKLLGIEAKTEQGRGNRDKGREGQARVGQ